jgi:hypothetical protein
MSWPMSDVGTKRTSRSQPVMSAIGVEADIDVRCLKSALTQSRHFLLLFGIRSA